jgi:hypothetical protein
MKHWRILNAIKCYTITIILLLLGFLKAQAKVVTVGPTDPTADYTTIAAAVNDTTNTLDGDTIRVIESGTFTDRIQLGSAKADNLTIEAAEGVAAILDPSATAALAVLVTGVNAGCTLRNLTIHRTLTSDGQTVIFQSGVSRMENVRFYSQPGDPRAVANFVIAELNATRLDVVDCWFISYNGQGNGINSGGGNGMPKTVPINVSKSLFIGLDNGMIVQATFNVDNCDFYGGGGGNSVILDPPGTLNVTDSILANHGTGVFVNVDAVLNSNYNIYDANNSAVGGDFRALGAEDVQADPLYVDPANRDFHVQEGSPALTGSVASAPPAYRGSQGPVVPVTVNAAKRWGLY